MGENWLSLALVHVIAKLTNTSGCLSKEECVLYLLFSSKKRRLAETD
jgi:hypothetical protein